MHKNHNNNYNRGGGNRNYNNQPNDSQDDLKNKLSSLIIRIGDKPTSALESNIDGLVNALSHDISNQKSTIKTILFNCISQLPYKTPIYGTIVGLLNAKNEEFGKEIVNKLVEEINLALEQKKFNHLKLLIRFIPELINSNVLPIHSIFELYDTLLSFLSTSNYTQNKSDFYVHLVLSTIPWIGEKLSKNNLGQVNALLEELEGYFSTRNTNEKKFYQPYTSGDDKLEAILKAIKSLRDDSNWVVESILKPHSHFQEILSSATQHALPTITIPDDSKYEYPIFTNTCFSLFNHETIKPIEKFIVEEYLVDIMYFFNSNPKEASNFLYSLPVSFEVDDIVVESIFGQMFQLPEPSFKIIYYSVIMIELFKTQSSIIPVFAYAVNNLFENIDQLDIEVIDRFSTAFSHHLSNLYYKWIWADWEPVLDGESTDPVVLQKRYFIKKILESIVRLSYLDKIKSVLPPLYLPYLPPPAQPIFKFYNTNSSNNGNMMIDQQVEESKELVTESHKLLLLFKTREPLESIITHIMAIPSSVNTVELLTKCILHIGSTSFSHLTYAIERYITLFKTVFKTEQDNKECIRCIEEYWKNSQQHQVIVIDKFITFKIINPIDTISWFFYPENVDKLTESSTWEIIHNSIEKTIIIIDVLTKDLEEFPNLPEKQLKLNNAINEQQQLLTKLLNGLHSELISLDVQSHPLKPKLILGYLKSITRKYFTQIKPLLQVNQQLIPIINQVTK